MDDEIIDESELQVSNNFFVNFYNNNKVLVWIFLGIIIFILIMSLLTKGGSNNTNKNSKYEVVIEPNGSVTIPVGYSKQFTGFVKDYPNEKVVFSIEDDKIAKVDNGNVTALNYGTTKVIATYVDSKNNKYTDSCEIVIADGDPSVRLTNVEFKEGDLFMPLNEKYQIALVLTPSLGYVESKEFVSTNEKVVNVDNTGLVTSVGVGEATIIVNVNDGQFRKELKVYVSRDYTKNEIIVSPSKISFTGELRKIKVGETSKLELITVPENADQEKLTWKSSDESIVTVNGGIITGVSEGHAAITVKAVNGQSAIIDIEVEKDIITVTDINLSSTDINLTVGQSTTITPIIVPDNASNKVLSYASLDNSIAMVEPNNTGTSALITALKSGTTTIVITSVDGVEKRLTVIVNGSQVIPTPTDSGNGNDATIKVRVNGEIPVKTCSGQSLKSYSKPTITISLNSGVGEVKYCYSTSICTPLTSVTSNTSFTIEGTGLYILRIKKFDHNGNEISSGDGGNYVDGALEYYINTKGSMTTCVRPYSQTTGTTYRCALVYNPNTKILTMSASASNGSKLRKTVIEGRETSQYTVTTSGTYTGIAYFQDGGTCTATSKITVSGATTRPATASPTPKATPTTRPSVSPNPSPTASTKPVVSPTPRPVVKITCGKSSDSASQKVVTTYEAKVGEAVHCKATDLVSGDSVKAWYKDGSEIANSGSIGMIFTSTVEKTRTFTVKTNKNAMATVTITWKEDKTAVCTKYQYYSGGKCVDCPRCNGVICFETPSGATSVNQCFGTVPAGKKIECNSSSCNVTSCTGDTYSTKQNVNYSSTLKTTCTACGNGKKANATHTGCDNVSKSLKTCKFVCEQYGKYHIEDGTKTLQENTDYTCTQGMNTTKRTFTYTCTGKGNYYDTITATCAMY